LILDSFSWIISVYVLMWMRKTWLKKEISLKINQNF